MPHEGRSQVGVGIQGQKMKVEQHGIQTDNSTKMLHNIWISNNKHHCKTRECCFGFTVVITQFAGAQYNTL